MPPFLCVFGQHTLCHDIIANQGIEFGICARCGTPLVRADAGWSIVPKGYRVIWRPVMRRHADVTVGTLGEDPSPSTLAGEAGHNGRTTATGKGLGVLGIGFGGLMFAIWFVVDHFEAQRRSREARQLAQRITLRLPAY